MQVYATITWIFKHVLVQTGTAHVTARARVFFDLKTKHTLVLPSDLAFSPMLSMFVVFVLLFVNPRSVRLLLFASCSHFLSCRTCKL